MLQNYNTINHIPFLRLLAGFNTQQKAADYFEVHLRTWRRWEKTGRIKKHIRDILKIKAGYLPYKGWHNFRFKDGEIWTPQNFNLSPNVIESLPYLINKLENKEGYEKFISARKLDFIENI